jgi:hydrogenase maturation protease
VNTISPILIACCGNPSAGDDALGHLVAQELRQAPPPKAEILDLAMRPAALLDRLEGRRVLILVDAAQVPGMESGRVIECDWADPNHPLLASDGALSTHGFSLADQLELAAQLGILPPAVRIVAVTIGQVLALHEMSPDVMAQVPKAAELVRYLAASAS